MNVFEDCESAKHEAIWCQRGKIIFDPNTIFIGETYFYDNQRS